MTRKAQLTIFILIGILLVISFFLIFYISNNRNENAEVERTAKLSLESDQIKVYIESCLKSVAENGVFFIASRGGYYNLPNDYFTSRPTTAFYIKINQDVSPSLKDVEKELSKYIMDQLDFCILIALFQHLLSLEKHLD